MPAKTELLKCKANVCHDFVGTKIEDVGNQEYEEVKGEGGIFGFDNKKGAYKHTATPSWVNKPPQVKGTPSSTKEAISVQTPQDEYEDVMGEGDIFGYDKKGSKATSPSWANKAPPVKGIPPSSKKLPMYQKTILQVKDPGQSKVQLT